MLTWTVPAVTSSVPLVSQTISQTQARTRQIRAALGHGVVVVHGVEFQEFDLLGIRHGLPIRSRPRSIIGTVRGQWNQVAPVVDRPAIHILGQVYKGGISLWICEW